VLVGTWPPANRRMFGEAPPSARDQLLGSLVVPDLTEGRPPRFGLSREQCERIIPRRSGGM